MNIIPPYGFTRDYHELKGIWNENGEEVLIKIPEYLSDLDNYKGQFGRTYKSDYKAILNWVVDEVSKKYRHLIKPMYVDKNQTSSGVPLKYDLEDDEE